MRTVLKTPDWVWPGELSASLCDAIIEEGNKQPEQKASLTDNNLLNSTSDKAVSVGFLMIRGLPI